MASADWLAVQAEIAAHGGQGFSSTTPQSTVDYMNKLTPILQPGDVLITTNFLGTKVLQGVNDNASASLTNFVADKPVLPAWWVGTEPFPVTVEDLATKTAPYNKDFSNWLRMMGKQQNPLGVDPVGDISKFFSGKLDNLMLIGGAVLLGYVLLKPK